MPNWVEGGFNTFGDTLSLRIDEVFPFIQTVTGYCPDADGSRTVDLADFAIMQRTFGQQSDATFVDGDFDLDHDVDFDDVTILIGEMGTACPAP